MIAAPPAGYVITIISINYSYFYGGTSVFTAGAAQNIGAYYGTGTAISTFMTNGSLIAASSRWAVGAISAITGSNATAFYAKAVNAYNPVATEISGNAANDNYISLKILYMIQKYS